MSDPGRHAGECEHGRLRGNCLRCAQVEIERMRESYKNAMTDIGGMNRQIVELAESLNKQTEEVSRLKAGRFTEEEFQALCHSFSEDDACRFAAGCVDYNWKLFGEKGRLACRDELQVAQELAETATAELHRLRSYAEEMDRITAGTANEFDSLRMEVGTLRAAKAELEEEVKDLRDRLSTVRLYG